MAGVEERFRDWRAKQGEGPPAVDLLSAEEGTLTLAFSRDGGRLARVVLMPLEGGSFFAEGQDEEAPEEVEDWLTEANSYLSEQAKLSLPEALSALWARTPKAWRGEAAAATASEDEEELVFVEDSHEEPQPASEEPEERAAKRAAYAEDRRWGEVASSAAQQGSRQASQVLMREMRALLALSGEGGCKALEVDMVQDNLYHWCVKMHAAGFPESCPLRGDLERFAARHASGAAAIVMDVVFPNSFPMEPPFIRVLRPRFQMHTGHITIGGSVCMQLLTPSGWLPSVSLENVFVSIRSEMVEGGGRVDFSCTRDYSMQEAREAFRRVADRYGWLRS